MAVSGSESSDTAREKVSFRFESGRQSVQRLLARLSCCLSSEAGTELCRRTRSCEKSFVTSIASFLATDASALIFRTA